MEEKNNSYSIYIDKRPIRQLYVFNKTKATFDNIDAIISYNSRKWGGRYNQILIANANKLSDDQWRFVRAYDPDFVKLSINASKDTLLDLDRKATPLQVSSAENHNRFSPRMEHDGVSILPTIENIRIAGNSYDSHIVLFDTKDCSDDQIKTFIQRNFGTLDLLEGINQPLRTYQKRVELKITDKQSFIEAISSFNDFKTYVFPIQLCSIGDSVSQDREIDDKNNFYLFVGDSPLDLIDFWNNPINLQHWTRTYLRQLWIPESICNDSELEEALKKLIKGRSDPYGTGHKNIIFQSKSVKKKKLEAVADKLTKDTYNFKKVIVSNVQAYPDLSDYFSFSRMKQNMDHIRASGQEERVILNPPDVTEGVMGGEYWMNDFYIQLPEKKVVTVNLETWLQLPRNNSVTHAIIKGPTRITSNGLPSVLASRSNQFNGDQQELTITLPKSWSIFASIIMNVSKHYFTNDLRAKHTKSYEYQPDISRDGKHIYGFLEVFGSMKGAYQVLEDRHWREFFELMANVSEDKESKRLNDIKSRFAKKIPSVAADPSNLTNGEFIDWLSNEVLKTAKVYSDAQPKASDFKQLEKILKRGLKEFNTRNPNNQHKYSKENAIKALSRLTDSGVVQIGYELRCPSCLNNEWRILNDINQYVECRGCGYEYPFPPEISTKYRLNSLIEKGIRAKGVVPAILALGALHREASNFFDFVPPIDIYKKKKRLTDLDICCIIDGQFVIGEVKANQKLLNPKDCDKMIEISKAIRPDKVVFCSMDRKKDLTKNTKDKVDKVKKELDPLGIEVEWFSFDQWLFEYSPLY